MKTKKTAYVWHLNKPSKTSHSVNLAHKHGIQVIFLSWILHKTLYFHIFIFKNQLLFLWFNFIIEILLNFLCLHGSRWNIYLLQTWRGVLVWVVLCSGLCRPCVGGPMHSLCAQGLCWESWIWSEKQSCLPSQCAGSYHLGGRWTWLSKLSAEY